MALRPSLQPACKGHASPLQATGRAATAEIWPHPLTDAGRIAIRLPGGTALDDPVAAAFPGLDPARTLAVIDGRAVPPGHRDNIRLHPGHHVVLRPALAGGDSNPLQIIGTIALLALGAWLPGAPLLAGLTAFQSAVVTGGILLAGGLVLNALVAPPQPAGGNAQPEPIHSLTGGSNRARP